VGRHLPQNGQPCLPSLEKIFTLSALASLPGCRRNPTIAVNSLFFLYLVSPIFVSPFVQTAGYMLLLVTLVVSGEPFLAFAHEANRTSPNPSAGASRYVLNSKLPSSAVRAPDFADEPPTVVGAYLRILRRRLSSWIKNSSRFRFSVMTAV